MIASIKSVGCLGRQNGSVEKSKRSGKKVNAKADQTNKHNVTRIALIVALFIQITIIN